MARFGIEIECYTPTTRAAAAAAITAAGVTCREERYGHSTPTQWKIVTDASLGYDRGMEVVSPPLPLNEEGLRQVRVVMEALDAMGATVNVSCGLHVHIEAPRELKSLKNIAKCYAKFEQFFDHIMPRSRRANANRFVASNRARYGDFTDASANRAMEAITAATTRDALIRANQSSRYYKLNMEPLNRYGTIEFRQHSGTVNADKAVNWIKLLAQFVEAAAVARPRARGAETQVTPAQDMQRFFKMFSIDEEQRVFYRARHKALNRAAR